MHLFDYQQSYFWFNNTIMQFPKTFFFDDVDPDYKNKETYCVHFWWKTRDREKKYDLYKDVLEQEECSNGP